MPEDGLYGLLPDTIRKLNRIRINLSLVDSLLAFRLAVESDDLDVIRFSRLLQCRPSSQSGGIVDGKDPRQVGVRLQGVLCRLVPFVLHAAPGKLGDDVDSATLALPVVLLDDFLEALDSKDTGLDLLVIQDHDLAAFFAQSLNHGFGGERASTVVVSGDVADYLTARGQAGDVGREDGDSRIGSFLDCGTDGLRIAGAEDNGIDFLDDEVLDLVLLFGDVELTARHQDFVAEFRGLACHAVGNHFEEGVGQCHHR